ncbi:hypothetical protein FNV43_RR07289 [Rhamnella rubrinervis]|uniref:FAS1 domain-containing protein n=1 Tax=Rhamnella rubrinervis TaxID=2594499 RepID=A0A8K0HF01_9ROSA|nr:hypothetical protein FNV43_RR07289 [Rhamnella rubrinervis]
MALRFLVPLFALIVISATPFSIAHRHHHHRHSPLRTPSPTVAHHHHRHSPSPLPTPRPGVAHHSPSPIPTPTSRPTTSSLAAGADRVLELERQLLNIILSGAVVNPVVLNVTLFAPENDDLIMSSDSDPFTLPYHLLPQRLTFSDLQRFQANVRLPTLLPGKSILITGNSVSDYIVDGARVTQPDLYISSTLAVHGIEKILDYTVYGDGLDLLTKPFQPRRLRYVHHRSRKENPSPALLCLRFWCFLGFFFGLSLSASFVFLISLFLAIPGEPRGALLERY